MPDKFNKFFKEGKLIFDSGKAGPRVVIMAGVHGNEPCGLHAFKKIFETDLILKTGTVTFLLGSKKAVKKEVRAFECNLNRMFRPDNMLSTTERESYEYDVSRQIMNVLDQADILLDIHSSSAEDTRPFVICEPQSYDIVNFLPVNTVVSGLDVLHPTGTDGYMNSIGKKGICIECGNHNDEASFTVALRVVSSLLSGLGMVGTDTSVKYLVQDHINVEDIYIAQDSFHAVRKFGDFEQLPANELIGLDGDMEVRLNKDSTVLFVSDYAPAGEEAFVTGVQVEVN